MVGGLNAKTYHRQQRAAITLIVVLIAIAVGLTYYATAISVETGAVPASPRDTVVLHFPGQLVTNPTFGFDEVIALLNDN